MLFWQWLPGLPYKQHEYTEKNLLEYVKSKQREITPIFISCLFYNIRSIKNIICQKQIRGDVKNNLFSPVEVEYNLNLTECSFIFTQVFIE